MNKNKLATILTGFALMLSTPVGVHAESGQYIDTETLEKYTWEIGNMYDVDPFLLQAICEKESNKEITAKNGQCVGLMQVSQKWHSDRMSRLGVADLYDPYENILVATDYIAELFEENSDILYVLMRYNMKTSTANDLYSKNQITPYAKNVAKRAEELKKEYQIKQKQLKILEEQKMQNAEDNLFPMGGISIWLS